MKSDKLHTLIHSLSPEEKRNFHLYIRSGRNHKGGRFYARLFDSVGRMKIYDEKKLIRKFRGEKFCRQPHVMKNYLFGRITESLADYHREEGTLSIVRAWVEKADVLFGKKQYEAFSRWLAKAKVLAYRYEHFLQLLEILWHEQKLPLLLRPEQGKDPEQRMEEIRREEISVCEKYNNHQDYLLLHSRVHHVTVKDDKVADPEARNRAEHFLHHPLLRHESAALSFKAKTSFYTILSSIHAFLGHDSERYEYTKKLIETWASAPLIYKAYPRFYLAGLELYVSACGRMKKWEAWKEGMEKIRRICSESMAERRLDPETANQILTSVLVSEAGVYNGYGAFEKSIPLFPGLEKLLEEPGQGNVNFIPTVYNLSYACFGNGDYRKALSWLNRLVGMQTGIRHDAQGSARILRMASLFELRDFERLESEVLSAYRYFNRYRRLYPYDKALLDYIRYKLPKIFDPAKINHSLQELKSALEHILENPEERMASPHFDLVAWLESKITGRPFAEIVRKKAQRAGHAP